jgi:hypothetical protein
MVTLRIYDLRNRVLALDLRHLVDLLAPRSLEAGWTASPVRMTDPAHGRLVDEFMMTGSSPSGQEALEVFAASGWSVSGVAFSEAAHAVHQVIWGTFIATLPEQSGPWVVISAIDSTFYEVTSADEVVLGAIRSAYKDVRVAAGPVTSLPIERV